MESTLFEEFYVILQRSLYVVVEVSISYINSEIMHSDEGDQREYKHKENVHPGREVVKFLVIKHHLLVPVVAH